MYPFKQTFNTKMDGTAPPAPPQWPLNPAAYQNVANDEVDWAALAAQWIYMKETCPYDGMPEAPPPPKISRADFEEKGEAPMEVEKDDEQFTDGPVFSTDSTLNLNRPPHNNIYPDGNGNPNWDNAWNSNWRKKPGWNTWTNPNSNPSSALVTNVQLSRPPLLLSDQFLQDAVSDIKQPGGGYWISGSNDKFLTKQKVLQIKDDSNSKANENDASDQYGIQLDATKRKTLPAWIRQGLEKMERDKLKNAEREREEKERFAKLSEQKNIAEGLATTILVEDQILPTRSKFDSESDSDDNTIETDNLQKSNPTEQKVIKQIPHKSKQEQLQDLMLVVRKSLTEILLEVTNEEIRTIASDTLAKIRSKARKAKPVRKTALTSLTGGLGLGIYADSDNSGNSSSDDSNDDDNQSDDSNSDNELKETIKRRKQMFESKAREIEAAIAMEEEKERWRQTDQDDKDISNFRAANSSSSSSQASASVMSNYKNDKFKDSGEIQHENIIRSHGTRKEKKTSRFSDPSDTVKNLHVTHGSIIYEPTTSTANKYDSSTVVATTAVRPTTINNKSHHYYDNNHKDSNSPSSSSSSAGRSPRSRSRSQTKRQRRRSVNDSSSGGDSDTNSYKEQRRRYKSSRRSPSSRHRSSSSERKYRSYSKTTSDHKSSYDSRNNHRNRERERVRRDSSSTKDSTSTTKSITLSASSSASLSSRDHKNYNRSYSNSSSGRDPYSRSGSSRKTRSRSRSPRKNRKNY